LGRVEPSDHRLVTFDLDGTLLEGTVFQALSRGAGVYEKVAALDADYEAGRLTLEECFSAEYPLFVGLAREDVERYLAKAPWRRGIDTAVELLAEAGLESAVLTDQPSFCCEHLRRFGLQKAVCSPAPWNGGAVPARVDARFDKLANLRAHLRETGLREDQVIHVGNGPNDLPVFRAVGLAVAVNPLSREVAQSADLCFEDVDDLAVVAEAIVDATGEAGEPEST